MQTIKYDSSFHIQFTSCVCFIKSMSQNYQLETINIRKTSQSHWQTKGSKNLWRINSVIRM